MDSNIIFIKSGDSHILVDAGTGLNHHLIDKQLQPLGSSVSQITEHRADKTIADIDKIQIIKKTGKSLLETHLIQG